MASLVRTNLGRVMWRIMKEFKVLPTDSRFKELTGHQLSFILESLEYDNKIQEKINKGIDPRTVSEDMDTSWWDVSHEEFEPLVEGHDEKEIARQVEERLNESQRKAIKDRFANTKEYEEFIRNGGKDEDIESAKSHVKKQLELLRSENSSTDTQVKTNETVTSDMDMSEIQNAIDLFNGEDSLDNYI